MTFQCVISFFFFLLRALRELSKDNLYSHNPAFINIHTKISSVFWCLPDWATGTFRSQQRGGMVWGSSRRWRPVGCFLLYWHRAPMINLTLEVTLTLNEDEFHSVAVALLVPLPKGWDRWGSLRCHSVPLTFSPGGHRLPAQSRLQQVWPKQCNLRFSNLHLPTLD